MLGDFEGFVWVFGFFGENVAVCVKGFWVSL